MIRLLRPGIAAARAFCFPFYDFCFTPVCFHCSARLHYGERQLCPGCWEALEPVRPTDPLLGEARTRLCSDGLFDECLSLFHFGKEGPLQSLLHELKYGGKTRAGERLGRLLGERLRDEGVAGVGTVVLPVPLHPVRARGRGYNQAEVIARGVASATGGSMAGGLLRRVRNTPTQTALGLRERAGNVKGAFALKAGGAGRIRGREVVIIDDVITTGSTLRACAEVIRCGEPARLLACGIALAE